MVMILIVVSNCECCVVQPYIGKILQSFQKKNYCSLYNTFSAQPASKALQCIYV